MEICLFEWQHAFRDVLRGVDKWIDGKSPKIAENSQVGQACKILISNIGDSADPCERQ